MWLRKSKASLPDLLRDITCNESAFEELQRVQRNQANFLGQSVIRRRFRFHQDAKAAQSRGIEPVMFALEILDGQREMFGKDPQSRESVMVMVNERGVTQKIRHRPHQTVPPTVRALV